MQSNCTSIKKEKRMYPYAKPVIVLIVISFTNTIFSMDSWSENDPFSSNLFNSFQNQNNFTYYSNNQSPVVSYPQIAPPPSYSQATSQTPSAYPVPPTTQPPILTQRLATALATTTPSATHKTPQSQAPIPELSPEKNESEAGRLLSLFTIKGAV